MRYVLDTNILIHYLRQSDVAKRIDKQYNPLDSTRHEPIISVVTVGEIRAIAKINHWGQTRLDRFNDLCQELIIADINTEDVIERYAEIDAFSQGKLTDIPLTISARNMGKNDLWIAATASILDATLLTTDLDFGHLSAVFLKLETIKI
jgi:tRNA(fMet)-specific endonuclease VapC